MVVSLGGVLHAVNPATRKTLWSFASGSEMSTTSMAGREKETREINSSLEDGLDVETEDWSIFTGPDGKLYVQDENGISVSFGLFLCSYVLLTGCTHTHLPALFKYYTFL